MKITWKRKKRKRKRKRKKGNFFSHSRSFSTFFPPRVKVNWKQRQAIQKFERNRILTDFYFLHNNKLDSFIIIYYLKIKKIVQSLLIVLIVNVVKYIWKWKTIRLTDYIIKKFRSFIFDIFSSFFWKACEVPLQNGPTGIWLNRKIFFTKSPTENLH